MLSLGCQAVAEVIEELGLSRDDLAANGEKPNAVGQLGLQYTVPTFGS